MDLSLSLCYEYSNLIRERDYFPLCALLFVSEYRHKRFFLLLLEESFSRERAGEAV